MGGRVGISIAKVGIIRSKPLNLRFFAWPLGPPKDPIPKVELSVYRGSRVSSVLISILFPENLIQSS